MKRIILSLITILSVGVMLAGATRAVFSSSATVNDNTFATGTLEIRVNGQPTIAGFSFTGAAPGDCVTGTFDVNNYGAPWFAGPSNLSAKELVINANDFQGDTALYNALTLTIGADRGWGSWMPVYTGALTSLTDGDLLGSRWTELAAGSSETIQYQVCLPTTADDTLQGKSATFDFVVAGYTPHR